ncbi:MAG: aldehyde ferredoxin oxidoreductase family protein [Candidatus Hydrothermia bacterium]
MTALRLLRINLSDLSYVFEALSEDVFSKVLLGRGLGDYVFLKEVDPQIDPLSPDNKIVIAPGPFAGTTLPGAARLSFVSKSPLTGTLTSSNVGGQAGFELALCGIAGIIIEGTSSQPVAIFIKGDDVTFLDAGKVWGKSTSETHLFLRKVTHSEAKTIEIGPAGENLAKIAGVFVDGHRAAGRGGIGAVFGSKKLKGIAILGRKEIKPLSQGYIELTRQVFEMLRSSEGIKRFRTFGTTGNVRTINLAGSFPTKNFRETYFEAYENINGTTLNLHYFLKAGACAQCPVSCNRVMRINWEGKTYVVSGPEYETLWAFGGATCVSDPQAVIMAHHLANEYGFDGISLGSTIACLMDLYEDGIARDLPFPVNFGDRKAMIELIHLAGRNEGVGRLIKDGSYVLSSFYGHPEYSMSVKKQEMPAYDPRGIKGMGLGYATSTRGACHLRGFNTSQEVYQAQDPTYRLKYSDEKVDILIMNQNMRAIHDSLGICSFVSGYYDLDILSKLIETLLGLRISPEEIYTAGERIWNIERFFNLRAGFSKADDTLPQRLFEVPSTQGPSRGEVYDKGEFLRLLELYYEKRGWDREGQIKHETLRRLEIE